jgi:hypothetical protein
MKKVVYLRRNYAQNKGHSRGSIEEMFPFSYFNASDL